MQLEATAAAPVVAAAAAAAATAAAWLRFARDGRQHLLVIANMTPQLHRQYRVGVPKFGWYRECMNTDASEYWGSGQGNMGGVEAVAEPCDGQPCSVLLTLPPLATVMLVFDGVNKSLQDAGSDQ